MLIFAADTCCMAATAALIDDTRMIAQTVVNHNKTHSQKMMPQIADMFKNSDIDINDVDVFAAAIGPGSFTGVRIGVAAVKGMAQAADKPCIGISTLAALANNVCCFGGIISPILDARRNQVYNALFEGDGRKIKRLTPDRALPLDELLAELKADGRPAAFVGDGVFIYRDEIEAQLGEQAVFPPKFLSMNLAGSVGELALEAAQRGEFVTYGELVPSYVRLSQAEQDKKRKENTL